MIKEGTRRKKKFRYDSFNSRKMIILCVSSEIAKKKKDSVTSDRSSLRVYRL